MEEIVWKRVKKGEMSYILSYDRDDDTFSLLTATNDGQNAMSGSLSIEEMHDLQSRLDQALASRELGGER